MSGRGKVYGKIRTGWWWALVRGPEALPVVFRTLQEALANRDSDERIVKILVVGSARFIQRQPKGKR